MDTCRNKQKVSEHRHATSKAVGTLYGYKAEGRRHKAELNTDQVYDNWTWKINTYLGYDTLPTLLYWTEKSRRL